MWSVMCMFACSVQPAGSVPEASTGWSRLIRLDAQGLEHDCGVAPSGQREAQAQPRRRRP